MSWKKEREDIENLFRKLKKRPETPFPKSQQPLLAPEKMGVYVIRESKGTVVHVGRTPSAVRGLRQRLKDHLQGKSSFVRGYLDGAGSKLHNGYTFQYLEVLDDRQRALLEHLAIGLLCPLHLGLGGRRKARNAN